MNYKFPLQVDPFNTWDRIKVCSFILSGARLTQGDKVKQYEQIWANFTGSKYAILVNSGSSANFLIAQRLKDKLIERGEWSKRKIIVLPALTWATSITCWTILGFKPHFIDITRENWGLDYNLTYKYLKENHENIAGVFPTALLGMNFDESFFYLKGIFPLVEFLFDGCEASFNKTQRYNILSRATSSTSTFFAHYAVNIEGGVIFCNNEEDYIWYLMARNHGLVRSLYPYKDKIKRNIDTLSNPAVHKEFDFNIEGQNFRNTDLHTSFGILDSARWNKMIQHRRELADYWKSNLNAYEEKRSFISNIPIYEIPYEFNKRGTTPFSLPIVVRDAAKKEKVQQYLQHFSIESRPIISGSLRFQKIFKKYMKNGNYPIADYLHTNGLYIGLNNKLNIKELEWIVKGLNEL